MTLPPHLRRRYGTTRGFKRAMRREVRFVQHQFTTLERNARWLPYSGLKVNRAVSALRLLQHDLRADRWGR